MRATGTTRRYQGGATSVQVLVILVPVIFAFMGFAVDLARLYLVRSELQNAANAAALAAAAQLIGTEAATDAAISHAQLSITGGDAFANRYNFGANTIGGSGGLLSSEAPAPTFFETYAAATGAEGETSGSAAKYARVEYQADAPLVFFGFLPIAMERKTSIRVAAVAGVSAPLCTVCGTEPVAVAALDASDTTNFGFTQGTQYTLGYQCNAPGSPSGLNGTQRIPYVLLNRYNTEASLYPDENAQALRIGAQGMLPTSIPDNTSDPSAYSRRACMTIGTDESVWSNAAPLACNTARVGAPVQALLCGLSLRFTPTLPAACAGVPDSEAIAALYLPDTDVAATDTYAGYTGAGRRIITIAIVATLSGTEPMQPLAYRQFFLEPASDAEPVNPGDQNGRFLAMYIGYPAPVPQGRFDNCAITAGPGKVVLHQ